MTFSMIFEQASESRSSCGSPSLVTVSTSTSRIEAETQSGWRRRANCAGAFRPCPHPPRLAATRTGPGRASTSVDDPECRGPCGPRSAEWPRRARTLPRIALDKACEPSMTKRRGRAGPSPRLMFGSIWLSPNSASFRPNGSIAASQANKPSSLKSPLGRRIETPTTPRPTGSSPHPKHVSDSNSTRQSD
jgi:hypothetical protein